MRQKRFCKCGVYLTDGQRAFLATQPNLRVSALAASLVCQLLWEIKITDIWMLKLELAQHHSNYLANRHLVSVRASANKLNICTAKRAGV